MKGADSEAELSRLMKSLASDNHVYVRCGQHRPGHGLDDLPNQVHSLITDLRKDWQRTASGRDTDWSTPVEIEARLEPIAADAAVDLMTELAAEDLLWSHHCRMDLAEARETATRVVSLFEPDTIWWTNRDAEAGACNAITACTLDGLIAASDEDHFVALIQVCED